METKNDINCELPIPEASYADLCKAGVFGYKRAKLTIIWRKEVSKNKQIIILKKIYPELKNLSSSKIHDIVQKNKHQWQFGEMGWGNAVDLIVEAGELGLEILIEEVELTGQ